MYLHIGNNNILNITDLIGIYNIESIRDTEEYKKIIEDLESKHLLTREDGIEEKTLILAKREDNVIGYISNISSTTIAKRTKIDMK